MACASPWRRGLASAVLLCKLVAPSHGPCCSPPSRVGGRVPTGPVRPRPARGACRPRAGFAQFTLGSAPEDCSVAFGGGSFSAGSLK